MHKFSMKQWATDDQPRQKFLTKGPDAVSNAELLAILINNGTPQHSALELARELLQLVHNDLQELGQLRVQEIVRHKIKGLGEAKAITIAAALELGVRRNSNSSKKEQIRNSADIAQYLKAKLEFMEREVFVVVFLNRANKIIHQEIISQGGLTGTVADPRIILKRALAHNATSLILCHNHPSGNLLPSKADELLTKKIEQAALLFDIQLIDHLIVSSEGYYSFADEGKLGVWS